MSKTINEKQVKENNTVKDDQNILNRLQKENGSVSNAIKLMAKHPGTVKAFMPYRDQILENGNLTNKESSLIALAATIAVKSKKCISVQARKAINAGASEDEVVQTMLIVALVSGNSHLNMAYESVFEKNSE
jgi:alkylhydroperoxidase/carboxymuconolactone decarboxylase family protein YurZ